MRFYSKPEKIVKQGDIVKSDNFPSYIDCPKVVSHLIILSYSCDIEQSKNKSEHNKKIKYISFSPIIPLNYFVDELKKQRKLTEIDEKIKSLVKELINYRMPKYFFIPKIIRFGIRKDGIVQLDNVITLPFDEMYPIIEKDRLCSLNSPLREKLGYMTGYMYNRIALEDKNDSFFNSLVGSL